MAGDRFSVTRSAVLPALPAAGTRVGAAKPALPHSLTAASGGRDRWSAPRLESPQDPASAALACLREVLDPELPVSLVDLGIVYGVEVEGRIATVRLTFTATACPCMEFIREDVTDRLLAEPWLDSVRIEEVWDPPWTTARITPEGRRQLARAGVGA
jgi:metal-sulfur cluster biosynthetic enzyme